MNAHALQKAFIKRKDDPTALVRCAFNPKELSITKSATWQRKETRAAKPAPTPEFTGTNPRTLQMELFFDAWESASGDVSKDLDQIFEWTNPTTKSLANNRPNPPVVVFHWGTKTYFDAYVKQVSAKYTLFKPDGTPVRATAGVTFEEIPATPARQNPTSGGPPGRRTHVVAVGDSLQSIAYCEYGNPALWRGLADANGIDDPLRLPTGTTLLVPPARQAAERS